MKLIYSIAAILLSVSGTVFSWGNDGGGELAQPSLGTAMGAGGLMLLWILVLGLLAFALYYVVYVILDGSKKAYVAIGGSEKAYDRAQMTVSAASVAAALLANRRKHK